MYEVYERIGMETAIAVDEQLPLDHLLREKGRFKTETASGIETRVFLERGNTLQIGEVLKTQCGKTIQVTGAQEDVITATCDDWETFSKACYHLGNRHVKLHIGDKWLRITPDHVLEEMLQLLGLATQHEQAIFSPESGAYSQSGENGKHHHHSEHMHH